MVAWPQLCWSIVLSQWSMHIFKHSLDWFVIIYMVCQNPKIASARRVMTVSFIRSLVAHKVLIHPSYVISWPDWPIRYNVWQLWMYVYTYTRLNKNLQIHIECIYAYILLRKTPGDTYLTYLDIRCPLHLLAYIIGFRYNTYFVNGSNCFLLPPSLV